MTKGTNLGSCPSQFLGRFEFLAIRVCQEFGISREVVNWRNTAWNMALS